MRPSGVQTEHHSNRQEKIKRHVFFFDAISKIAFRNNRSQNEEEKETFTWTPIIKIFTNYFYFRQIWFTVTQPLRKAKGSEKEKREKIQNTVRRKILTNHNSLINSKLQWKSSHFEITFRKTTVAQIIINKMFRKMKMLIALWDEDDSIAFSLSQFRGMEMHSVSVLFRISLDEMAFFLLFDKRHLQAGQTIAV